MTDQDPLDQLYEAATKTISDFLLPIDTVEAGSIQIGRGRIEEAEFARSIVRIWLARREADRAWEARPSGVPEVGYVELDNDRGSAFEPKAYTPSGCDEG